MLPCTYSDDHTKMPKKRKTSDEIGCAFLTPGVIQSSILLSDDSIDTRNTNSNNNNANPTPQIKPPSSYSPVFRFGDRFQLYAEPPVKRQAIARPRSRSDGTKRIKHTARQKSTITTDQKSLSVNININVSPPGLLTIPQANMKPLPITPPRNPFAEDVQESTSLKLDPKTMKLLQIYR